MTAITKREVSQGQVTYLVPEILSEYADCLTNARAEAVARGKHPFIVLAEEKGLGGFLCVPLFSNDEVPDLLQVDELAKGGPPQGWIGKPSFFHPGQFWVLPAARFSAASLGVEYCEVGKRKTYGRAKRSALKAIALHRNDSDQAFRHIPISN